jgi:hypothetical protein
MALSRPTKWEKKGFRLLTGVEDIDKKLAELKIGTANKIARPALAKACRHLLKKMKAGVPPNYKDAKKALGVAVDSKGGKSRNQQRAKVGAGVGINAKKKAKISDKQRFKRAGTGDGGSAGVGIGPENIHWFILGADGSSRGGPPRTHKKTGKSTGVMKPVMPGLVKDATTAAQSEMLNIMRAEVTTRLATLAAKK